MAKMYPKAESQQEVGGSREEVQEEEASVIGRKGRNPTGKRPVMAMDNSSDSEECEFSDIGAMV